MLAASAALLSALSPDSRAPAGSPDAPPVPPARGGGATPQAFHHGVNHDKSGYYRASDRRLLLAAMVGLTTAIVPEMSVDVN